jgi:acyl-CoA thioesterase YciA
MTAPADKALPIPVEPRGELTVRVAAMPADTNANGDIFGGWVLSQMDAAGGIASAEYAKGRVVTIAIDAMTFIRPVKVGDVLCVYTAIDGVGRTSMKVHVEAWARRRRTHDREKVTDATFTFVAIDEDGRPRPVTAGQKYNGSAPASEDRAPRRAGALRSWTDSGHLPYWPRGPPACSIDLGFLGPSRFYPARPENKAWISLDFLGFLRPN